MKKLLLVLLVFIPGIIFNGAFTAHVQAKASVYKNIYPNIDLQVKENENYAQYQWQVKPGGSIEDIRFENKNAILTESGHWTFQKPLAYQVMQGKQVPVDIDIIDKEKNRLGFMVRNYHRNTGLWIRCDLEKCYEAAASASGTTYYIRTDGGTAAQCTGTADAPYPGSGTNQLCAWSHPFWALNSSGN